MNKPFIEIDAEHFTLSAFETKPIEGYEAPTNKETGEQFPNCCPFHKSVFEGAESWFSKFPNCCDQHKAMVSKWWYNKANYSGIAEKIVKQLSYTEHHISERINIDDWYKDITDYIEYNVSSFGHPAIGLSLYLGNVQKYIKTTNSEIPKIKRQVLIEFIETYYNSPIDIDKTNKTDLNVLYSTYQKWLKVFPFEISFFSTLKPHFEKQLPILNGKPEMNKYTGLAKAKMHTKSSLIDALLNLTNNLLTQINTTTLYEKGLLTEPQKIKLELVLNERKMKLKQGYVNSSKDEEQRYRKILKEWIADEKRFIDEVTPIVKALPPQPISVNESRTKKVIFETITNIDKQGWQYAFVSEQDYNLFTDLLTNFFEYKPYTLPETIIQLKRTCKTKVAKALGEIHKELSNENKLSTDTKYFQLIRVLSHFEKETEGDLYKALTR
jgi:hypothetical protein